MAQSIMCFITTGDYFMSDLSGLRTVTGSQSVTRWRSSENQFHRWVCGRGDITALIGPTRRPPAGFPQHFKPFAWAGLALTGIGVGLSRVSDGESELREGAVSR